jgi:hypothetical protein
MTEVLENLDGGHRQSLHFLHGTRNLHTQSAAGLGFRNLFFHDCCLSGQLREMFCRIQSIWRKRGLDMAIRGNRFVRPLARFAAFELVDVLADQVGFDAVASDEGQTFLKDFEFSEGRELVDHGEEPVFVRGFRSPVFEFEFIGQKPHDHVHDYSNQGFEPGFIVGFRDDYRVRSKFWFSTTRRPTNSTSPASLVGHNRCG